MSEKETVKYNPAAAGNAPSREKYWKELSIEEKIERMRWVVTTRLEQLERQVDRLAEKLDRLELHEHGARGIVIPLDAQRVMGVSRDSIHRGETSRDKDEVFF